MNNEMMKRNLAFVVPDAPGDIPATPKTLVTALVLGAGGPHDLPNGLVPGDRITAVTGTRGAVRCYYHWSGMPSGSIDRMAQTDERGVYYTLKAVRIRETSTYRPAVGQWIMVMNGTEKGYITRDHRATARGGLVFDPVGSFDPYDITEWVPASAAVVPTDFAQTKIVGYTVDGVTVKDAKVEDPVTEHDEKALAEAVIAGEKEPTGDVLRAAAAALEKLEKENHDLKIQVKDMIDSRNHYQERLSSLWQALEEQANDRDWCSEYDDFAEDQGGPARERGILVVVDVTTRPNRSEADDVVGSLLNSDDGSTSVDVREIEIKHRVEVPLTTNIHPGGTPDDEEIATALSANGWDYSEFEYIEWHEQ